MKLWCHISVNFQLIYFSFLLNFSKFLFFSYTFENFLIIVTLSLPYFCSTIFQRIKPFFFFSFLLVYRTVLQILVFNDFLRISKEIALIFNKFFRSLNANFFPIYPKNYTFFLSPLLVIFLPKKIGLYKFPTPLLLQTISLLFP